MSIYSLTFLVFLNTLLLNILIILTKKSHLVFTGDTHKGPQKIHRDIVPRIGGVSIFLTIFISILLLEYFYNEEKYFLIKSLRTLLFISAPAFLIGLLEDILKDISIVLRFIISFVTGSLAYFLFDININGTNIITLDNQIQLLNLIPILTILFFAGSINSINIIDGMNGLASLTCLIILFVLFIINIQEKNVTNYFLTILIITNIIGFLIINWLWGSIFLGDSGAYLLGVILAVITCKTILNNQLSLFLILTLFFYPIWEISYSIWRRILKKEKIMRADNKHMHSLIYISIKKYLSYKNKYFSNFLPTLIISPILIIGPLISLHYYQNPKILIILFLILYILNTFLYKLLEKKFICTKI